MRDIEYVRLELLQGYQNNPRKHPKRQIRILKQLIAQFGFVVPILVDAENLIISGDARLLAARELGTREVPIIKVTHLTKAQVRAFRIADNRIAELGEWDREVLAHEFRCLLEIEHAIDFTGFEAPEIDHVITTQIAPSATGPEDHLPETDDRPVTCPGDVWRLEEHRLACGDARDPSAYEAVLGSRKAQVVFTDPPYNIRIDGNVCGSGAIRHREFVMASGEMSPEEYREFLRDTASNLIAFSRDGSVHYLCIDWRHLYDLEAVCREYYSDHLNTCVWVKSNGGMGPLYRSQQEFVLVLKNGTAQHINNVQLGRFKRNRTNVWHYEGVNTPTPARRAELEMHPTVKPVALVADAILDCSKRGGIVLDPFLGSGTTIIAAEKTERRCCGIELDPIYVDTAIRRWQAYTKGTAIHVTTGWSFDDLADRRLDQPLLLLAPRKRSEGP